MPKKFNTIAVGFVVGLFAALLPVLAYAHATPLEYVPAASSVLTKPPTEVQIHFSERVEPRVSSIAVIGPDGSRADHSDSGPDPTDPRIYRVSLKDAGAGNYTVSWEVISADDGHFAKGAYVFSVGAVQPATNSDANGFQTVHSSSVPEAATLALELIGDALILGALLALAFIWRPMRAQFSEANSGERDFIRRFQLLYLFGCLLATAGGAAYLLYKTNELALLQQTAFTNAWRPFLSTASARWTIYRMIGAGFLLALFAFSRKQVLTAQRITGVEYASFIVLVLIDLARARISHAAASSFEPVLGVAMNFVHLLFKDVWIGGIIALVWLCAPVVRKSQNSRMAAFALTSFSRIASVAFGVAGVAGTYVVWLHLKSFSFVLTTDWGKRFAILSIFAMVLLAMRLFAQLYCEPKIVSALQEKDEKRLARIFSWLGFTLPAEVFAGLAVLAVTSILIITTPPLAPHFRFGRTAVSQGLKLSLAEQPYETGKLLVTAENPLTTSGENLKSLVVTLANQAAGIGPISVPVEERFAGGYVFAESLLAPAGVWTVNIAAQREGAYDATASFTVDFPREIAQSDAHAEDRTFSAFDVMHLAAALVILVASILLYRNSSQLHKVALSGPDVETPATTLKFWNRGAWVPPVILILLVLYFTGGIPPASSGVLKGSFQRTCEDINYMNVWHESVPERAGHATADLAMPGCTTGIGLGQFHFVDAREFAYFIRPARAKAQLATQPVSLAASIPVVLTFTLRDLQGNPVQDLVLDHNRILHVVIANEDFSVFAHIHTEDFTPITPEMLKAAVFPVHYTFPKPGRYLVSADFMERGYAFSDQFYLNVEPTGATGDPKSESFAVQKSFAGYDVALKTSPHRLKAGVHAVLRYHVEKDGRPFTSMSPYLAVPMHVSIIREDLREFVHTHGLLPVSFTGKLLGESIHASHLFLADQFGPDVEVPNVTFPSAGVYHLFGEFSAAGRVVVTDFTVKVE